MNGSDNSLSARHLSKSACNGQSVVNVQKKGGTGQDSKAAQSFGERVRTEVRNRLGCVGDELFDEDDDSDVEVLEQEEVIRGTRGLGALWKLSLAATLSFVSYMLFSGTQIEARWVPNITERERIPRIYRPRSKSSSFSSSSS